MPLLSRSIAFVAAAAAAGCGGIDSSALPGGAPVPSAFTLLEATMTDVHDALAGRRPLPGGGRLSCVALAQMYLQRIERLDASAAQGLPLQSIVSINPRWEEQARALDEEYAVRGAVGPLHCAPVLLKDLYDTWDFPTTASSLALLGSQPPDDAFTVARLRAAGALILGKAGMTEFAYFTQSHNSRSGRIGTPYDPALDTGGSSGGSAAAIAANFGLLATGSDTCASIRLPPSNNSAVGIRSSVGLVSQDGLVPLSHTQDVGGPITRTVADAVAMLGAMAGPDAADAKTLDVHVVRPASYMGYLKSGGLAGKHVGVLRTYGSSSAWGENAELNALMEQAVRDMAAAGAVVVDPVDLPGFASVSVIVQEFADHLDEYLGSFDAPRASTQEVFASGLVHPVIEALVGASLAARDTASASYHASLERREESRRYVEAEMDRLGLDVLVYPAVKDFAQPTGSAGQGSNCGFGSTTGQPSIVVPAGFSAASLPLPASIEFLGRKWDEAAIIEAAYAYEQATQHRRPPPLPE
jgi:amidase